MEKQLLGEGLPPSQNGFMSFGGVPGDPRAAEAWRDMPLDWVDFEYGESSAAIQACKAALCSGRYQSVVCVDLSLFEGPDSAGPLFERHLGPLMRAFVEKGGAVAFPTSEGGMIQPTLRRLFGTTWERSGYYRTTWTRASGDVAASFGAAAPAAFSAKAASGKKIYKISN